jgi:hypothetical protein
MEDINSVNNIFDNFHTGLIDKLNIDSLVDMMVEIVFRKRFNLNIVDNYFDDSLTRDEKISIIKQILLDKISYMKLKNTESDRTYQGAKKGLTSVIIRTVKNDKECRDRIFKECKNGIDKNI